MTELLAPTREQAPDVVKPPPGNPRFPLFDSLRGLAALAIVLTHVGLGSGANYNAAYGALLARLDIGVTLFFVLSGFLLYRPFVAARIEDRPALRLRDYARRRVLRIVPAYWLALTVLAIWPGLTLHGPALGLLRLPPELRLPVGPRRPRAGLDAGRGGLVLRAAALLRPGPGGADPALRPAPNARRRGDRARRRCRSAPWCCAGTSTTPRTARSCCSRSCARSSGSPSVWGSPWRAPPGTTARAGPA